MLSRFIFFILVLSFLLTGCSPSTFIISKNGRAYYFGRESDRLFNTLCVSGDLRDILDETSLPERIHNNLYKYNCTEERSEQKVIATFLFMTPEEKKALKRSFIRHDYTINYVPC